MWLDGASSYGNNIIEVEAGMLHGWALPSYCTKHSTLKVVFKRLGTRADTNNDERRKYLGHEQAICSLRF